MASENPVDSDVRARSLPALTLLLLDGLAVKLSLFPLDVERELRTDLRLADCDAVVDVAADAELATVAVSPSVAAVDDAAAACRRSGGTVGFTGVPAAAAGGFGSHSDADTAAAVAAAEDAAAVAAEDEEAWDALGLLGVEVADVWGRGFRPRKRQNELSKE